MPHAEPHGANGESRQPHIGRRLLLRLGGRNPTEAKVRARVAEIEARLVALTPHYPRGEGRPLEGPLGYALGDRGGV